MTNTPKASGIPPGAYCNWSLKTETKKYYIINIERNDLDDRVKIVLFGDNGESYTMDSQNDTDGYFEELKT